MIGLFLHLMIPFSLQIPLTSVAIPLLQDNIDPSYFWFRDVSSISQGHKLFLRIGIMLVTVGHGSTVLIALGISIVNMGRMFQICFKSMSNPKLFRGNAGSSSGVKMVHFKFGKVLEMSTVFTRFGKSAKFPEALFKYRQIAILATVGNQITRIIIPVGLMIILVTCCISGYFIIKLSSQVPLVLTLFAVLLIIVDVVAGIVLIPLGADITVKSNEFVGFWKLQGFSGYRKRQLRSCKPLVIKVGPFFDVEKKTKRIYLSQALYYTVNLVISV